MLNLQIPNDTPGARQVTLVFAITRSTIDDITVESPSDLGGLLHATTQTRVWIGWDRPLDQNEVLGVLVETRGEPVTHLSSAFGATDWRQDAVTLQPLASFAVAPDTAPPATLPDGMLQERIAFELARRENEHFAQLMRERRDVIERATDHPVIRRWRLFFFEYDLATNPAFTTFMPDLTAGEKQHRITIITNVMAAAVGRVVARREAAQQGQIPSPKALSTPTIPGQWVAEVSRLQLDMFIRWFPDGRRGVDAINLGRAFEMFANGELRTEYSEEIMGTDQEFNWNGEPDSAYYFLFAEFALMAIDYQVATAGWRAVLPFLVMTQEIFVHAYGPEDRPPFCPDLSGYGPTHLDPKRDRPPKMDVKANLRIRYATMTDTELELQYGKNLLDAFATA